jgi:hypothetical protein
VEVRMSLIKMLDIPEIIKILDNFDILHEPILFNEKKEELYGLVDPNESKIYLSKNTLRPLREETIIHEIIHASDILKGYNSNEKLTEKRSALNYEKIYGHKLWADGRLV